MIKIGKITCVFLCAIFFTKVNAQYLEFVENKGQWQDNIAYKGDMKTGAIALKKDGGYRMLLHNTDDLDKIAEHFHTPGKKEIYTEAKTTNTKDLGLHSHVYEISFLGGKKNPVAVPEKYMDTYNNYYIDNDKSKWASGCKIYQAIVFKDIYPNIDVRYYTNNDQLKYDFIINEGGNPGNIILSFDGADGISIKNETLSVKTSVTTVIENKPYSFQPDFKGKNQIDCKFKLIGNLLTFKIGEYDKTKPLIIDPSISFCSFTGSTADNWGFTATYDGAGNLYGGGIVFDIGFPVTNGSTYQGGINSSDEGSKFDMGIMKFNNTGTRRLYATYIGGSSGNDQPHSLIEDGKGNLVISGRSSSANYPTTYQNAGPCGGRDIVLTILNSNGNIIASRLIGGTGDDGMNIKPKNAPPNNNRSVSLTRNYGDDARSEVILDENKNVLLASCTQSSDFFTTANAFQTSNASQPASAAHPYHQDGVFMKLTPDLSSFYICSYFGGNDDDAAFVLSISPTTKEIFIGGGTLSQNLPGVIPTAINPSYAGGECDGFITVLNATGTQILRTTYLGTNSMDIIYGLQHDKKGFVYVAGATKSNNWPVINAPYFNAQAKQFICKINPQLTSFVYSTTFGTPNSIFPNISITAFLVDRCENVYVSGWGGKINEDRNYETSGTVGMPTANRINFPYYPATVPTDGSDFYFFVLEKNATNILYGDFFGQRNGKLEEHVDGGTSRFDKNGVIYQGICANCASRDVTNFPTTPGAYAERNGSSVCNLAVVKIEFNLAGVGAAIRSSIKNNGDTSGCIPLTIKFEDTLAQGKRYYWNFGDGSPVESTPNAVNTHSYTKVGTYKACVVSVDSSTCNQTDTSCRTVRIRDDIATLKVSYTKTGNCFDNTFSFNNTASTAPAGKPFKSNSFIIDFGDGTVESMGYESNKTHKYINEGFYKIKLSLSDTNYCNSPVDTIILIKVVANLKATYTLGNAACLGKPIQFYNKSNGGDTFEWQFGDGNISNQENPVHTYTNSGTYTVHFTVQDSLSCNKIADTFFTIIVSPSAQASFTYNPNPTKVNTPVNFVNNSTNASSYFWDFGDGSVLNTMQASTVSHLYNRTKTFTVRLIAYNKDGCSDTATTTVDAKVDYYYDVANAFSPNGDGKNEHIYVRGFGIRSMKWNIYNRWGRLVFTSNDGNIGWDGKYNGEVQPQEVYHYTLIVDFFDDSKSSKTGDITLLR